MDYLSFDLRIGEWNPQTHAGVVEVLHSPAGEGRRYPFVLEVEVAAVLHSLANDAAQARRLGRLLAKAVFRHEVALAWYESYQIARERQSGLRLRLHIESWELSRLPWELLYDVRADDFMAFDERTSLARYIRLNSAPPALRQSKTLRILGVTASPVDEVPLNWQNEVALLKEAVDPLVRTGRVRLDVCEHATRERLHVALLENRPDVVHFIGHAEYDLAEQQGYLVLEGDDRQSVYVNATEAARLLRRYGANAVILNACETARGIWAGLAPTLVRADIPAVVAMQWPVEDRAAITFAKAFYRTLAAGRTIDECVSEGRVAMDTASPHTCTWAAPVLFIRSLNGQLWAPEPAQAAPEQRRSENIVPKQASAPDSEATPEPVFRTRGPLRLPEDRELIIERPELRRALRLAQQPAVSQYLAILSPRQTGKTTLLLQMMNLLRERQACVFVDLSVLRGQDAQSCFRLVASQLATELSPYLGEDAALGDGPADNPVAFLDFCYRLGKIVPVSRIVIFMDEVGALAPEVSDTFFNTVRTIFTQGRGLTNALAKYLFVFSGAVDLYGLTFGTNSPLNICEKIYLEDLPLAGVGQILGGFERIGIPVAEEAAEAAYALTAGHPYLTVRLCALMESARPKKITAQSIQRAAAQMLMEDDNVRHLLHELERQTGAKRHLYSIFIEGLAVPFSRNNPILASLEMIGAIRPAQPCVVRNALYERALRQYFGQQAPAGSGVQRRASPASRQR